MRTYLASVVPLFHGALLSLEVVSEDVQTSRNALEIMSASGAPLSESSVDRSGQSDMHRYESYSHIHLLLSYTWSFLTKVSNKQPLEINNKCVL